MWLEAIVSVRFLSLEQVSSRCVKSIIAVKPSGDWRPAGLGPLTRWSRFHLGDWVAGRPPYLHLGLFPWLSYFGWCVANHSQFMRTLRGGKRSKTKHKGHEEHALGGVPTEKDYKPQGDTRRTRDRRAPQAVEERPTGEAKDSLN